MLSTTGFTDWSLGLTTTWSSRLHFPNCWHGCAACCAAAVTLTQETSLQLADLRLDLIRRRAERNGQRIDLTAKEFSLLELLLRRQGEVLPKSLIASQVWDMNFDSDTNVIEVAIRRLRLKIDDNHEQKLIHTVRGMGYVLEERSS